MTKFPPWRYRFIACLLLPLAIGHLIYRSTKDGGWRYFRERLGFAAPATSKELHIHAASVGEVITALPLLNEIQRRNRSQQLLITTNTPTGAAILLARMPDRARHAYLPMDFAIMVKRFLQRQQITESWIIETEIWPWLFTLSKRAGQPITIVNGRLSHRSRNAVSNFFNEAYRRALQDVRILARTEDDAGYFVERGAEAQLVATAGNLKWFTNEPNSTDDEPLLTRPYVLLASTHDNEEEQLAEAWLSANKSGLMVIAPRHPERGARLQQQLGRLQQQYNPTLPRPPRRSLTEPVTDQTRLYLADTLGELPQWFRSATATFIGGSLVHHGGHNVLEAARAQTPIVTGPHTFNFELEVKLLSQAKAITIVDNAEDAIGAMLKAVHDTGWAKKQSDHADKAVKTLDGMLHNYCDLLTGAKT